jgi:hypothetical protein
MSTQLSLPMKLNFDEVIRKQSLGAALEMCADVAGFQFDKTLQRELGVDKAQFSRWQSGGEGVVWPKFAKLMDVCGNDAPLLWMVHQRGYDLASLRRLESETERELRVAREQLEAERVKVRVLTDALNGRAP